MKLSKPVKAALIVAPVLVGAIFIIKYFKPKSKPTTPPPPAPDNGIFVGEGYAKYKVNTITSNLNVRSGPAKTFDIVGTLEKGEVVLAQPSLTKGWFVFSTDGVNQTGYVSSDYLVKL